MKQAYIEYWSKCGEYGLERIRRARIRKEKRKSKDNRMCQSCGKEHTGRSLHKCPYDEEMSWGDYSGKYCNCCSYCTRDCALSV